MGLLKSFNLVFLLNQKRTETSEYSSWNLETFAHLLTIKKSSRINEYI